MRFGRSKEAAVTPRAVLIGLAGAAALCAFTPFNDYKVAATYLSGTEFPVGALWFLLVVVLLVNPALWRLRPAAALRRGELLTVWTLVAVSSGLPSSGLMRYFLPHIAAPEFYSNAANEWEAKLWGRTPDWLKIRDPDAVRAFFNGYPPGQEHVPWGAWAGPLFFWGLLAVLFLTATFCMAGLWRRQWVVHERFSFPLVALPILLSEEPEDGRSLNTLLRHPLLWAGTGATLVLHTVRGLHLLYPGVPDITLAWNLGDFARDPPWSGIGWSPANLYPLVIGLAYLLPAEVSLSIWLFFLFYKAELVVCALFNWDSRASVSSNSLFHSLEAFGGALTLIGWSFWAARRHLRDVWEKAIGGPRAAQIDDSGELFSYRTTAVGLCLSYGGIAVWEYAAGIPVLLVALSLVMLTLALLFVSWMVTQAGMLFVQVPFVTYDVVSSTVGTAPFPVSSLYTLHRVDSIFLFDTRETLMPTVLNGAKAADAAGFGARRLGGAMVASVGLGLVVSGVASLVLPYYNGGGNSLANGWHYDGPVIHPLEVFGAVASVPVRGSWVNGLHIAAGLVGVLVLLLVRARTGFGLHPIGFLGASAFATHMLWFSLLLGWLVKSIVLRVTGIKGYRSLLPLFLGLMVGDVTSAVIWIVLGNLTGVGYNLLPV